MFLLILVPLSIEPGSPTGSIKGRSVKTIEIELPAVSHLNELLTARGEKIENQGILIETLDGHEILASKNADVTFNPASVMKLSTSFVALSTLGPDYRFRTNFFADGQIDSAAKKLDGDLVVEGGNDPMFSAVEAEQVARELDRAGITHVSGKLRITGGFTYFAMGYEDALSARTSAEKLLTALRSSGIRIEGGAAFGPRSGRLIVSHYSDQLSRILLIQNAHSLNSVAEIVGRAVGGPIAIQNFLVRKAGLKETDIFVGRPSGLDLNRITPRAAIKVLRQLIGVLDKYGLQPQDIMPVAGVDSGTLRTRFSSDQVRGAIVAKTGTLISLDGGVSTLVGLVHTRNAGTIVFAVFNSEGSVEGYRHMQDQFLTEVIEQEGGAVPAGRMDDAIAGFASQSIVQDFYNTPAQSQSTEHLAD